MIKSGAAPTTGFEQSAKTQFFKFNRIKKKKNLSETIIKKLVATL